MKFSTIGRRVRIRQSEDKRRLFVELKTNWYSRWKIEDRYPTSLMEEALISALILLKLPILEVFKYK
jgi:predicted DNA-binding ArsR family transcriptional regulator